MLVSGEGKEGTKDGLLKTCSRDAKSTGSAPRDALVFLSVVLFWFGWYGNDPSAGSPTETLLRLHLPLNDEV